jgi:hypothetical protein
MAQLRDKITSELLAEGTPLEVALVAELIGFDEIIFDDVGQAFDPAAVLAGHRESIANLEVMAKSSAPELAAFTADTVAAALEPERVAEELEAAAIGALEGARQRVE